MFSVEMGLLFSFDQAVFTVNPHLVGVDIRQHDVLRRQETAHVVDDALRFHREGIVVFFRRQVIYDGLAQFSPVIDVV